MQLPIGRPSSRASTGHRTLGRLAEPLRDIARGGLAGLITGILVAGIGGRIVMRAAALLVPDAAGQLTENGNRIGEITFGGTLGLVLVGALVFGLLGSTVWVVVAPWIPGGGRTRAVVAMPVAASLAGIALIHGENPDFAVLRHDARTVLLLLTLVGVTGLAMSLVDSWLDRRLPAAATSGPADWTYLALTVGGAGLVLPIVLVVYFDQAPALGLALVALGFATLIRWTRRYQGRSSSPSWLVVAGRGSLLVAVVLGTLALAPDLASALGLS